MWPVILEKAFSKYHGNFGHTVGGNSEIATQTLTGSPYITYRHPKVNATALWDILVEAD